jgi:uridine kinase
MFLISVTGFSGSGKSTLSANLSELLSTHGIHARVVHMDDFYLPSVTDHLLFDSPSSIDWNKLNAAIGFATYDYRNPTPKNPTVVIYEGIFALPSRIVDIGFHIEMPFYSAYQRRMCRGTSDPRISEDHLRRMAEQYVVHPTAQSLCLVNGFAEPNSMARRLSDHVLNTIHLYQEVDSIDFTSTQFW